MDMVIQDDDPYHDPQAEHDRLLILEFTPIIAVMKKKKFNT